MTTVTNCPNCQTQFIVTDEQLSQHNGKVRCGQCMHVFDATKELVEINDVPEADFTVLNDDQDIQLTHTQVIENEQINDEAQDIVNKALLTDSQVSYFEKLESQANSKSNRYQWLMRSSALILVIGAILQSIYYWRNDIAVYYPKLKPALVQICDKVGCSIEFPKKIEFIIIDDSDMQEDADHVGLIHFSSTLINQAGFVQTYPNIELTLTDVEDKAKLRRIFKPAEYLPANTDIASGLAAGAEIKVKLALTAQDEPVAGYRISVGY